MSRPTTIRTAALAILVLGTFGQGAAGASLVYTVSVNTSSLSGVGGYLDFQFNPGGASTEAATAAVTNFQFVGGSLAHSAVVTGNASGLLPGTLTVVNSTAYNDIFQGFTFGNSFSLTLTLSGLAITSPGGTTGSAFALSLYGADQTTALLTTDPLGSVLTVNLNANGTATPVNFSTGSPRALVVTPVGAAVPEPPSLVLGLLGTFLAGVVGLTRWWRGSDQSICLSQA